MQTNRISTVRGLVHVYFAALLGGMIAVSVGYADEVGGEETAPAALLEKLDLSRATDQELFDAAAACRRLTVVGTEKSVAVLEKLLVDPRLSAYARTALENIGGEAAEAALKKHPARTDNASPVDATLEAAAKAVRIVLGGGEQGMAEFSRLLHSEDKALFHAALTAFRKFPGRPLVDSLAREQSALKPERRVSAILALLDREDLPPVPAPILEAARSDPNVEVRAAAIAVLGAFPDEPGMNILLEILKDKYVPAISSALGDALVSIRDARIDEKIISLLDNDDFNVRAAALALIGARRITSARDRLWQRREQCEGAERALTLGVYGIIADRDGFIRLLDLYRQSPTPDVFGGLQEYCKRSPDQKSDARSVVEKLPPSSRQLELLALLGGDEALKLIAEAAKSTREDEIRDQATKILGEWTGAEVAPVLLELSKSLDEQKYKVRTFRGFVRAVRQFDMPKAEKRALCQKGLEVAPRPEEKKLVEELLPRLK